ncbi:LysR family transcriptional regulator [Roseomonas sp. 18066]|uniref:LysR family transcriptional regulator n=1 Tax=Roseomonas sp. 18066 TaxID=2681412 RepID=UPI00135B8D65|nr:LysR family transcriptional regulator [Roseomonas sp. 18066]
MADPVKSLEWDDFRLILAVAEQQGLPAAAARLGVAHSTVFRRLGQIEALLGAPLFERHRTGYAATATGEEVVALAARMQGQITELTRRLAGQAVAASGEIRVATSDALLHGVLLPVFARFRAAHPGVRLDLVTGNAAANLSRRDADVAIRASEAPPETLVGRRAARIAWALYGAAGMQEADAPWLAPGDPLASLPAAGFVRRHVPAARVGARLDSVLALAAAAEAGMGIAHLPCFLGDARPALRRLAPPDPALASDLWLLTHPDLRQSPRIRIFLDYCAAEIAGSKGLIEG